MLAQADRGRGGVALVSGAAGMGKTALTDAFAGRAASAGATVARAAGAQAETAYGFGVIRQLVSGLAARGGTIQPAWPDAGQEQVDVARFGTELFAALTELAGLGPVVLVVDDFQYADPASSQCLLFLARRLTAARVLLVLTETSHVGVSADLMRQPHSRRIRLRSLSPAGTRAVFAERVPAAGHAWHDISGGSPLLAHALVQDYLTTAKDVGSAWAEPPVGAAFAGAVVECLHRCEPGVLEAGRALAVLGAAATMAAVGQLTGSDRTATEGALATLDRTGLANGLEFRHPVARKAVLDEMDDEERMGWHLRAAGSMHGHGTDQVAIARCLIAAGRAPEPWCLDILEEAARRAGGEGDHELAAACLRLAIDQSADPRRCARLTVLLAKVEWVVSPVTAARHLPVLLPALRTGLLGPHDGTAVAKLLLWRGDFGDMEKVLDHVAGMVTEPSAAVELKATREWLSVTVPSPRDGIPAPRLPEPSRRASYSLRSKAHDATFGFVSVLRGEHDEDTRHTVISFLQAADLADEIVPPVVSAVSALVHSGHADLAATWCDRFIGRAEAKGMRTWWAILQAVSAEIAISTGDLAAAEFAALAALDGLDREGWGPAIVIPLSSLVAALTMTGQQERAAEQIRREVPSAAFETRFGLRYLYVRGQHHLSSGRFEAALGDFLACGELMTEWRLDTPVIAPWRLGAAEVQLRLGRPERAAALAREQLGRAGPQEPRHTAVALRLLAATSDIRERVRLLRKSAKLLESGTDFFELTKTLTDLCDAYQAIGLIDKARLLARRVARVGGGRTGPSHGRADSGPRDAARSGQGERVPGLATLSLAERRVCALASRGYTNREISGRLHITVSTVEQHLTKVYRKLNVATRAELPATITLDTVGAG